jgi:hypothetical protein
MANWESAESLAVVEQEYGVVVSCRSIFRFEGFSANPNQVFWGRLSNVFPDLKCHVHFRCILALHVVVLNPSDQYSSTASCPA